MASSNREEVRDFLMTRRAKVRPEQVELPAGGHRRVPGLRRTEVALLAGVSVKYYAPLERGDLSGVSDSVLDAITGGAALVRNGRLDIIAANALGRALHVAAYSHPRRPVNLARQCFLDRVSAEQFYPDWHNAADTIVAILRAEAGRDPYDKDLQDLIGELSTLSDDFRAKWGRSASCGSERPLDRPPRARRSRHGRRGELNADLLSDCLPGAPVGDDHRDHPAVRVHLQRVQNPLYFLPGNQNATIQVTVLNFSSQFLTQYNLMFASILLVTLPPLIMFIFFNRKIVEGMAAGAVKG